MSRRDDLGGVSDLMPVPPDAVVRYAPHPDGLLDVHVPPGGAVGTGPLLVLLHGGFWRQAYDRTHTRAAAGALAAAGFVVVTPEYRRVGGLGGWPLTAEDVAAATGAAPALLEGIGLPTQGLTVVGHSAGGHLALWLANEPFHRPVERAVGLAPVADLRVAARARLGDGAVQALLGGEPEDVPDRYESSDPASRFRTRPSCYVRVVHGTRDDVVPPAVSEALVAQHPFVDLRLAEGADHFDLIDPTSAAWPAVLAALR